MLQHLLRPFPSLLDVLPCPQQCLHRKGKHILINTPSGVRDGVCKQCPRRTQLTSGECSMMQQVAAAEMSGILSVVRLVHGILQIVHQMVQNLLCFRLSNVHVFLSHLQCLETAHPTHQDDYMQRLPLSLLRASYDAFMTFSLWVFLVSIAGRPHHPPAHDDGWRPIWLLKMGSGNPQAIKQIPFSAILEFLYSTIGYSNSRCHVAMFHMPRLH